jgi:hypothetical protein
MQPLFFTFSYKCLAHNENLNVKIQKFAPEIPSPLPWSEIYAVSPVIISGAK